MKFIKLEILNLASLDRPGGEVICFDEGALGDSTIFSIVGPTGSGKSTILDAICLALYNRAPRYPRKKGDRNQNIEIYGSLDGDEKSRLAPTDPRNILTKGKKEGYSKLTFLANNGMLYRAEWYVRLKTKKYDEALTTLYRLDTIEGVQSEHQADWDTLPQIVGLDYEQFLRTVLIAQGSFANFLTAKENERYELLEKLIGCEDLYSSIAARIKQQRDDATRAYDAIVATCSAQEKDIMDEDALLLLTSRIAELEAIDKRAKEELGRLTESLTWYTTADRLSANIVQYEQNLQQAKMRQESFRTSAERLALHDSTLEAVALYREMQAAHSQIAQYDQSLIALSAAIAQKTQRIQTEKDIHLESLKQIAHDAANLLEQQRPYINRARQIQVELEALKSSYLEKSKANQQASAAKEQADKEVTDNQQAIQQASQYLQKCSDHKATLEASLSAAKQKKLQDLRTIEEQIEALEAKIQGVDIDRLNEDVKALLRTYTLMTSENWPLHRSHLQDGCPCPLCGATHHPYANAEKAVLVQTELGLELEKQQQLQKNYNETKSSIDSLNKKKDEANTAIRLQDELAKLEREKAENDVTKAFAALEAEKGRTDTLLHQQAEKAAALVAAAEALQQVTIECKAKVALLREQIGDKNPDAYEKALSDAKAEADKAVADKTEAISTMCQDLTGLKGQESATRENRQKMSATHAEKQEALACWLQANNAAPEAIVLTQEHIAMLASATDDWEQMRAAQKRVDAAYTSADTTLANERKAYADHMQAKPEMEKERLLLRKAELESQSTTELVDAKARLLRHETAKREMGEMFVQRQEAESLKREWDEIADAIGADGKTLRKIAQCYTLRFLIEHANVEIRKFSSRYELIQVRNSLGIRVIDHDRADDIRDTTSLSGGETFIVSLGLALGLSALSSRNISFDNLFIDEGFGTLDPDMLATVIDSLAMLQSSQGKKVGVISHTDTMSERIGTQIRIIKNGNSGSSHIEIYP